MDWLSQTTRYLPGDQASFTFVPGVPFRIRTVTLSFDNGSVAPKYEDLHFEKEYVHWVKERNSSLRDQPTFVLVMHERHEGDTKSIPYSRESFAKTSAELFQHRSLALSVPRTSTAIFNCRRAEWMYNGSTEQSIGNTSPGGTDTQLTASWGLSTSSAMLILSKVYNCKSDTATLGFEDDVLLSTTYFKTKPWTFSVMYGCTPELSDEIVGRIKRFKKSAFHPYMMPMVFADNERSRFLEAMELNGAMLKSSMLDLKNSLNEDRSQQSSESAGEKSKKMTEKDLETTKSWVGVSDLKIGLESFRKMLVVVKDQFQTFGDLKPRLDIESTGAKIIDSVVSDIIKARLEEMDAEIDTRIRECDALMAGMALAIQVEWNHHTRRDAKANIIIARLSHQDSAQMKLMSLVGMIFLPGTFLATLFSTSFFRWMPDDSPQIVSPYVAVYFGLTSIITAMTIFLWRWQNKRRMIDPELAGVLDDMVDRKNVEEKQRFAGILRRKRSEDSSVARDTDDVEMQAIPGNKGC